MLSDLWKKHPTAAPLALLFIVPLLIAAVNSSWLYTAAGYLDPWYNVGHFLHYVDGVFWPGHYKESRLSWIAPGYAAYRLFGPVAGNFILHFGALFITGAFVFLTLARIVSREAALLAAGLLLAYYPLHQQPDYQTIASAAYYAVTVYCLLRAAQAAEPRPFLTAAGFAFGASFHANILVVNMAPVLAALYLIPRFYLRGWRVLLPAAGWTLLGFLAVTLLLCAIAWAAGRPVLFFWPIVEIVFRYTADPNTMAAWWLSWSSLWFLKPENLSYSIVTFLVFVGSLLWLGHELIAGRREDYADDEEKRRLRIWLAGQFVYLVLVWCAFQSIGHVALQPGYFPYPLFVPCFMALAVLAERATTRHLLALAAIILFVLLFSEVSVDALTARKLLDPQRAAVIIGAAGGGAIVVGAAARSLRPAAILFGAAAFLFFFQALIMLPDRRQSPELVWSQPAWLERERCVEPSKAFREIVRLNRLFRSINPVWWQTWVWAGPREEFVEGACRFDLSLFRGSLISTGTSGLGATSDASAAAIPDQHLGFVSNGGGVAVITRDEGVARQLVERFDTAGKRLELQLRDQIDIGQVKADVYIYKSFPK